MSLAKKLRGAGGRLLKDADVKRFAKKVAPPEKLVDIMKKEPLIGVKLSLSDEVDTSGLGVEMQWMDPDQMISEATEVYPGILAVKRGYFPVGMCLVGSGDSYFYRAADGAIVRIPHDACTEKTLDKSSIEVVSKSITALVENADIERT
jgi:hypothetical protein